MRVIILLLIEIAFTIAFSSQLLSQEYIPDLDPRYWEDPDYISHDEDDVVILNKIGLWTYYKVDESNDRIDLIERLVTCIDCDLVYELCGEKISAISFDNCSLTYEIDDADCDDLVSPFWVDPLGEVFYEETLVNVKVDGWWYLYMSDRCPFLIDSVEVENCEIPLNSDICDQINISATGTDHWSGSYVSQGNGSITLIFDTQTVPDRLLVKVNGSVIDDSGDYSSTKCDPNYGSCIGTVNYGCGVDYVAEFPLSYNDVLDVEIIANTCNGSGTRWYLDAICDSNFSGNMPLTHRTRNRKDDVGALIYFPSPARDIITVKAFGEIKPQMVQIIDNTGRIIREIKISDPLMNISLVDIPSGAYIFKAIYETFTDTQVIAVSK